MAEQEAYLLLVDDEPLVLSALTRALKDEPYQVVCASDPRQALSLMASRRFQVVVSDERMPGMTGAELLAEVRKRHPETVRIMLTGHASLNSAICAVNLGEIYRFLTKPWDDVELRLALRGGLEKFRLEEENRRLLRTVRTQSQELKMLERSYPGISRIRRDARGAITVEEVSEEELTRVVSECND